MKKSIIVILSSVIFTGCASTREFTVNGQDTSDKNFMVRNVLIIGAGIVIAKSLNKNNNTCHVGPRGGTYTYTSNGNKNYYGC